MARLNLRGVFPPILTPFTREGEVDFEAHRLNLLRWNDDDLGGVLVLGSNSETPFLSEKEKLQLVDLTVRTVRSGRTVLAGTGCESTRETIRLTIHAADMGVNAVLIVTPFYYGQRMTDEALIRHYQTIADASPVPVLVYNVPAYTHLNISIRALEVLASHQNIAGMKESSTDIGRLSQIINAVPPSFTLLTGSAAAWYPALSMGIDGGILALSNIAGSDCAGIRTLYRSGNHDEARRRYLRLLPLNAAITVQYGIPGLKAAASLLGYHGCYCRSPLQPLARQEEEEIRNRLIDAGLLPESDKKK